MKIMPASKRRSVIVKLNGSRDKRLLAKSFNVPAFKLKKILVPVDFSDFSKKALRYAKPFAEQFGAEISVLYVFQPVIMPDNIVFASCGQADANRRIKSEHELELVKFRKRELGTSIKGNASMAVGTPFLEIVKKAQTDKADLIILATHGRTGLAHVLLGSTAERVVRHAPCPVLVVRGRGSNTATSKMKLKRILVPIDFSKVSKAALPRAMYLANRFGAEIILLHVVEKFPIDYLLGRELMNETITPLMKQAEAGLEHMIGNLNKQTRANLTAVVRDGTPFEEICRAARTLDADLIVLTSHGYTGMKRVRLGSTAERVLRHAHCPVLVVRELKHYENI